MAEETAEGVGVSPRVIIKLAVVAPSPAYRNQILSDVAREMGVAWEPPQTLGDDDDDDDDDDGDKQEQEAQKEKAKAHNAQDQGSKTYVQPPAPSSVNAVPSHAPINSILPSQQQQQQQQHDAHEYKTAAEAARAAREFADKAAAAAEAAAALAAAEGDIGPADESTDSGSGGGNAGFDETKVNEILNDAVAAAEAAEFAAEAAADDDDSGVDDATVAMLADIPPDQSATAAAAVPNAGIGTDVFSIGQGSTNMSEFDALTKRFEALKKK